ncbi:MAG TPA: Type 1 glutamine amidotransferase-like domain-containing protein, partial [Acidimicrobiales bacterium]
EELDLRDYFGGPDDLADRLGRLDLLWVVGGNTFVLARAMGAAGFPAALHRRAGTGDGFVYAGYSAGACVAGPDLRGLELIDEPDLVVAGYPDGIEAAGLGLVDFRIVPHWRSDHPESEAAGRAAAYLEEIGLAHRCLTDGDVVVCDDGRLVEES